MAVLDVSNPAHPADECQIGVFFGVVEGVALAGDYAYVADGSFDLRIINISDPASPAEAGFYDTPGYAYDNSAPKKQNKSGYRHLI